MLHERDALPLDRASNERLGRLVVRTKAREHAAQRRVVVPVAGLDLPPERTQLRLEVARARGSPRSACPTAARCGRQRSTARRAGRAQQPGAPPSSGPPVALRRRSSRRRRRRAGHAVSSTRSHVPWRFPCRASPSSPRFPARRRPDARRGHRVCEAARAALPEARRARRAPRTGPARRGPWTRRTRRGRDRRNRPPRHSARRRGGGRRCRAR